MDNEKFEILQTAHEYIPKLEKGIEDAAELFQSLQETKGSNLMFNIIDGLQWLIQALNLCEQLSENEVIELNGKLKEIVGAFENQDYILIGDLLQFELLPIINEISEKLDNVTCS